MHTKMCTIMQMNIIKYNGYYVVGVVIVIVLALLLSQLLLLLQCEGCVVLL